MRKIKILHLISSFKVGGAEQMLLKVLANKKSRNLENITVGILPGGIGLRLEEAGIKTYVLLPDNKISLWRAINNFYQIIKKEQPNAIVTYLIHADIFGRFFGKIFGVKIIICSKRGTTLHNKFFHFLDRLTSLWVRKYVCVSKSLADELIKIWKVSPKKVVVIPNGIELEKFIFKINELKKRISLGLNDRNLILTCTAHLRPGKGHDYLLQAFSQIIKKYPRARLLLIGADQGEGNRIKNIVEELNLKNKVQLLGLRRDVFEILKITDIFVLPSLTEGMSNTLLEAMASRCAIVASDIAPNKEVIGHNKNGLLFKVGSQKELVKSLDLLLRAGDLREKLSQEAKKTVQQKFAIEKTVQRWEELFERIL